MTQRERDLANIDYFLSDKVSVEGHSEEVKIACDEAKEYIKWLYPRKLLSSFWRDVRSKLMKISVDGI